MLYKKIFLCLSLFIFLAGLSLQAQQHTVTGFVADSVTAEYMAYVNIKIKNTTRGTHTDDHGKFSLQASLFDTLQFSFVGYKTIDILIRNVNQHLEIRMPMASVLLKSVVVYGNIKIEGLDKVIPKRTYLTTPNPGNLPQYGSIQTVGVGYTFKGVMSSFSKSEKEKAKLKEVRKENSKITTYLDVVSSPELKGELMKKYSLTEDGFYDILAKYNQLHYKSMYSLDSKTLISSISYFFSLQIDKK